MKHYRITLRVPSNKLSIVVGLVADEVESFSVKTDEGHDVTGRVAAPVNISPVAKTNLRVGGSRKKRAIVYRNATGRRPQPAVEAASALFAQHRIGDIITYQALRAAMAKAKQAESTAGPLLSRIVREGYVERTPNRTFRLLKMMPAGVSLPATLELSKAAKKATGKPVSLSLRPAFSPTVGQEAASV